MVWTLRTPRLARLHEDAMAEELSCAAWHIDDGVEVLRIGSRLWVATPKGRIFEGYQEDHETTREAVARLRGVS